MTLTTRALGLSGLLLTAITGLLITPGMATAETNPLASSTPNSESPDQDIAQINLQVETPTAEVQVDPVLQEPVLTTPQPEAEVNLGRTKLRFPLRNSPTVTSPTTTTTPQQIAAPQTALPQVAPQVAAPNVAPPLPSSPIHLAQPAAQPAAQVAAPAASYPPAVINLTTIQPTGYGAQNAGYSGVAGTPSAMPSNFQLVCSPTAGRSLAAANGGINNAGAGQTAVLPGTNPATGVAQQAVGSVLGGANAGASRPGLLRSLIPNPSVDVDLGPVTVAVPIPISAIPALFQDRGNNNATTNPQATPAVAPGQVNGSAITAAAPGVAAPGTMANPQAATNAAIAANNYPVPYGIGGPESGGLTQIVTSQHTIINLTTLQSVPTVPGNTQNASFRSVNSQPTAMQASTVQLVCNP